MSTVFLHVGQCGNQVSQAFWKKAHKDPAVNECLTFVDNNGHPRSVHVDSEPKVLCKLPKSIKIRDSNIVSGKRGRGSNWALGYYGIDKAGDDHLLEATMESLRKEIERCDSYSGCVMMHSLSGGTGSGLGSRLCEMVRDSYPMNYLMSCTFAPCKTGESPLQNYNSLLTLSKLQRNTDCIMLLHNDDILDMLQKTQDTVSFSNINNSIAAALCGVFLPTDSLTPKAGRSIGMEPWEMLRVVCPMPATKFVHVDHINKSKLTWENLMSRLLIGVCRYNTEARTVGSLGNVIVARGDSTNTFLYSMKKLEKKVRSVYNCVDWNPYPIDIWTAKSNPFGARDSASITIAANHGTVVDFLERVVSRSKVMYDIDAYLHWYRRHGAEREDFEESFETMNNIITDYKEAFS